MNTALGTCLPAPVSEKNVLKESSQTPMDLSDRSEERRVGKECVSTWCSPWSVAIVSSTT